MIAKYQVLVVDDEAAILRFLKPALEANSYQVASAATAAEGIKRIAAETPDIVLLDLGLPDGDGKDVIRQVRQFSDVPIVVLSAREREMEKSRRSISAPTITSTSRSMSASCWRECARRSATGCNATPRCLS